MNEKLSKIKEGSTVPGCIGCGNPIPPNDCSTCQKHSDYTCKNVKVVKANADSERK